MRYNDSRVSARLKFGIEFVFSEKCQVLGTTGDISLTDFPRYGILERPELMVSCGEHILFDSNQTAIKAVVKSATTPKNVSSFSPTVTLATRS